MIWDTNVTIVSTEKSNRTKFRYYVQNATYLQCIWCRILHHEYCYFHQIHQLRYQGPTAAEDKISRSIAAQCHLEASAKRLD